MGLFRRREKTLNEKLLREAGYSAEGTPLARVQVNEPEADEERLPEPAEGNRVGIPGVTIGSRPHMWDVFVLAEAPELAGDQYDFAALTDVSLIVYDSVNEDLSRLADAVELQLRPPYRASASRQDERYWRVSARAIDVENIVTAGDELELSSLQGERIFTIDGTPTDPSRVPSKLVQLGEAEGADFVVRAERLDGDLWDVHADPL